MLHIDDYELPDPPIVEDYDSSKALESAVQAWQKQVAKEWTRLVRDAKRDAEELRTQKAPFLIAAFNTKVRALVLILVVLAIITMPMIALVEGTFLNTFNQLIAPVTGVGGVIIGYWFGQSKDDPSATPASRRANRSGPELETHKK
jgi:hypothetical protein